MIFVRMISLIVLAFLSGCATMFPAPPPSSSAPFFRPTPEDTVQVATWTTDLDAIAMECAAAEACDDQVHFSRALVSLFENREAARASFEQVIALHPSSPFAPSSTLWLQLLEDQELPPTSNDRHRRILTELTAQWAREWMSRQQSLRAPSAKHAGSAKSPNVQALYKQVRDRDQRIAELRAQLDALKVIDQDQQARHPKLRAPTLLVVPKLEQQR